MRFVSALEKSLIASSYKRKRFFAVSMHLKLQKCSNLTDSWGGNYTGRANGEESVILFDKVRYRYDIVKFYRVQSDSDLLLP